MTRAKWDAVIVASWLSLATLLLLRWVDIRATDWLRFVLISLVVFIGALALLTIYGAWGLLTLSYQVDRNSIRIRCRRSTFVIPLSKVKRVIRSERTIQYRQEWWRWPASFMRAERRKDGRYLTMLATRPLHECILIDTGPILYALSPASAEQFLSTLQENFRIGPIGVLQESEFVAHTFDLQLLLGVDPAARRVLLAGLTGVLVLFLLLVVRYPFLPETMAVRFDPNGVPELVRDKSGLFLLPMIGFICWIVNGLWGIWMASRNQVTGAYLLWSGAVLVQVCLFFALLSLVR
ncbi:MAG: PH domain-containing protein [Caldilineaceae bacterium]